MAEIADYITHIKNKDKQQYAYNYVFWRRRGSLNWAEPSRGNLGYMAAQAVRIEVDQILKNKGEGVV